MAHRSRSYASLVVSVVLLSGCHLDLDPAGSAPTMVRYDLSAGAIPTPSDILHDDITGRLALPLDSEGLTAADVELRTFLNESDNWSSASTLKMEFSAPIASTSVTPKTFQIWHWGENPERLEWHFSNEELPATFEGPTVEMSDDHLTIRVDPPRHGWAKGGRYVAFAVGGSDGILDENGAALGVDTGFFFLRSRYALNDPRQQRAFPGKTREERLEKGEKLEELRQKFLPYFEHFESAAAKEDDRIAREQMIALWSFGVTETTELAMDKSSQRMPVPFDLLVNPDTGLLDLPPSRFDSELVADAKLQLNRLNGFAVSANPMFEFTKAVDPSTVSPETIELYRLGQTPVAVPIESITVMAEQGAELCQGSTVDADCKRVVIRVEDASLPLEPNTSYAIVVRAGIQTLKGEAIRPMPTGRLLLAQSPLQADGKSLVSGVRDDLAVKVENARQKVAPLLETIGRDGIVTAWPFTTMDPTAHLRDAIATSSTLGATIEPQNAKLTMLDAFNRDVPFESLFPGPLALGARGIYALRLAGVERVIEGTLSLPNVLDPVTRRALPSGEYRTDEVKFVMTIPQPELTGESVPVVIFVHAITVDRRFMLTVAGELAQRGFASIAIDLPYHGDRTACVDTSLIALPNYMPQELRELTGFHGDMIRLPPCVSGDKATCAPTGECLDASGNVEPFNSFLNLEGTPAVMDVRPASGAAFLDVNDIPHISDHFVQALMDLGSVKHSLRTADWQKLTGLPLRTEKFYMAGQSLGGILGAVYAAVDPEIHRAVLNVPGADLVDLFLDSLFFSPQFDEFFAKRQIAEGSYEHERLLNVARWLVDSVDPQTVAWHYRTSSTRALIQIDSGFPTGDIVIPNRTTEALQRTGNLPMTEYPSILHGDLVIPVVGDAMLTEMGKFLSTGEATP